MLFRNLPIQAGTIVSFVGAGGKTSLIFLLAYELAKSGCKVLVTTTTAMFYPCFSEQRCDAVLLGDEILFYRENTYTYNGCVVVAAYKHNKENNKLTGYHPRYVDLIHKLNFFDFILVEADGAKMKPIKCPAYHEPVIPKRTATVVGCVGLDSIGKRINYTTVHRPDFLLDLCKNKDPNMLDIINLETIITLAVSREGLFKDVGDNVIKIVFLNKADNANLIKNGKEIALKIRSSYFHIRCVVVACLKDTLRPIRLVL